MGLLKLGKVILPGNNETLGSAMKSRRRRGNGSFFKLLGLGALAGIAVGLVFFNMQPVWWLWPLLGTLPAFFALFGGGTSLGLGFMTPLLVMTVGAPRIRNRKLTDPAQHKKLYPHERIDAARPFDLRMRSGAPAGARFAMFIIFVVIEAVAILALRMSLDGTWQAMIALPVLLICVHRANFRRVIGAANEPYLNGWRVYPAELLAEIRIGGTARYFAISAGLLTTAAVIAGLVKIGDVLWIGFLIVFAAVALLGGLSSRRLAQDYIGWSQREYRRKAYWLSIENRLGGLLGVNQTVVLGTDAVRFSGEEVIVDPVPPQAQSVYPALYDRLLNTGEDDFMIAADSTMKRIHLVPVDEAEVAIRATYRRTGGLIIGEREEPYAGTNPNPIKICTLPPTFDSKKLHLLQEQAQLSGYTVVDTDLTSATMTATLAPVASYEMDIYHRVARLLNVSVWDLYMVFTWVNVGAPNARIDNVVVLNAPVAGMTPEKRHDTWRAIISALPGGSDGWPIDDDQETGRATLKYGEPLRLPEHVTTRDLVEKCDLTSDPMAWARVGYGIKTDGSKLIHYLPSVPHLLVAGKPGTGKSAFARHILATRLALGHQVVIFDHAKKAAFAKGFRDYALIWATENRAIANGLAFLSEEGARRYKVIRRLGYENWYDLTPEERREHNISPISIFFDELENALDASGIDLKATADIYGKDSPQVIAETKKMRAISFIYKYMASIGKVDRAAGLYLVVLTQFPYQEILKGIRNPLGMVVQLAATGVTLKSNEVQPALGPDTTEGIDLLVKFTTPADGGESIVGVGVMQDSEEGGLSVFKSPWLDLSDVQPFLSDMGVPTVAPWRFTDQLGIGLRAEETLDPRTPIEPPFGQMLSHINDDDDQDVVDLFARPTIGGHAHVKPSIEDVEPEEAASVDDVSADGDSEIPEPARPKRRKIDMFS